MTRAKQTTKTCSRCKQDLPITAFYTDLNAKDGHRNVCKRCYIDRQENAKRHDENYQVKHREPKPRKKRVANGKGDRSEYMRQYWQRQKERLAEKNRADYIKRKLEFVPGLATKNDKPAKAERMCEKCKNYPCFAGIESLESDFANEGCHAFRKREKKE